MFADYIQMEREDEGREAWIESILGRLSQLREEVREAMASDGAEAAWSQYQLQDAYNERVLAVLPEGAFIAEDTDETDDDVEARLHARCARAYRLGLPAEDCAEDLLTGGDR